MIGSISESGRNISMENWFTLIPMINDLFTNHRLTFVRTVKKNKEIPKELMDIKRCPVFLLMWTNVLQFFTNIVCPLM